MTAMRGDRPETFPPAVTSAVALAFARFAPGDLKTAPANLKLEDLSWIG